MSFGEKVNENGVFVISVIHVKVLLCKMCRKSLHIYYYKKFSKFNKNSKKTRKNLSQVFVFYNVGSPEISVAFSLALGIVAPAKQSQICEERTNLG